MIIVINSAIGAAADKGLHDASALKANSEVAKTARERRD